MQYQGRRLRKFLLALAFMAIYALSFAAQVSAYNTYGGHKCTRGVNFCRYYIYSDAQLFLSDITSAANRWDATSSPIDLVRAYDTIPSTIDIFYANRNDYPYSTYNAWTQLVIKDFGPIDPNTSNWDYGRVYLNDYNMNPNTTRSIAIIEHEMGHVFGLAHTNSQPNNIMCQESYGRTATFPSADDVAGINFLY